MNNLLVSAGPKLGIPLSSYASDTKVRRNNLTDEDIAFAIKKSYYRIICTTMVGLYKLIIVRLMPTGMYITESLIFGIRGGDNNELYCEGIKYNNWSEFLENIPNTKFLIPAPEGRIDEALKYYKDERRKEKKIKERRLNQAIEDYYLK